MASIKNISTCTVSYTALPMKIDLHFQPTPTVGNFVDKKVLVESANQFSLEELCRTQYSLKYFFRSHVDHQTYCKTLNIKTIQIVYDKTHDMLFTHIYHVLQVNF